MSWVHESNFSDIEETIAEWEASVRLGFNVISTATRGHCNCLAFLCIPQPRGCRLSVARNSFEAQRVLSEGTRYFICIYRHYYLECDMQITFIKLKWLCSVRLSGSFTKIIFVSWKVSKITTNWPRDYIDCVVMDTTSQPECFCQWSVSGRQQSEGHSVTKHPRWEREKCVDPGRQRNRSTVANWANHDEQLCKKIIIDFPTALGFRLSCFFLDGREHHRCTCIRSHRVSLRI